MHVHLSYTKASALPTLLAHGVTSVRDIGGRLSEIDLWRGGIQAGNIDGPRIFRCGPMLNGRFADYQLLVTNAAEARGAVRALQRAGVDFIKLHRMTPREAYFGIADEAKRLQIPFAGIFPARFHPKRRQMRDSGRSSTSRLCSRVPSRMLVTTSHWQTQSSGSSGTMEVASIQDDYRDREKASDEGRATFQCAFDDPTRGGLARGALKFAREMPLERVVELHDHLGRFIAVENGTRPVKLDDPGQPAGGAS